MHRCLLVLVPLFVVGACVDTPRENAAPAPDEGDCGAHVVTNSDEDGAGDRSAKQQCVLDAFASGDSVRLDVQLTTVEGDPIYYRYTVVGRRVVEATPTRHMTGSGPGRHCESLTVADASLATDRGAPME